MAAIGHFDVQLCTLAFANFRYIDSRYNSNVGQSGQLKYQVNCYTFNVSLKSNLVEFHTITGAVLIF